MIPYIKIPPYFLKIGSFEFRWYGLAYILGVLLGMLSIRSTLNTKLTLSTDDLLNFMTFLLVGILLGGRLGYILFYDLVYYLQFPLEIFQLWRGGMSFHGGGLGCAAAIAVYCFQKKLPFLFVLDCVAAAAPIGLGLGRLANFINGELYGRITSVPWAMVFPLSDGFPRHPSQLYEAFLEGFILWLILYPLLRSGRLLSGKITALFLLLYGLFRFLIEFVREPDTQLGLLAFNLSMGQWLSLTMILGGATLWLLVQKIKKSS